MALFEKNLETFLSGKFGEVITVNKTNRRVFCPFHDDKGTPNLDVNIDNGTYKCWACGARGAIHDDIVFHKTGDKARTQYINPAFWPPRSLFWTESTKREITEKKPHASIEERGFVKVDEFQYTYPSGVIAFRVERWQNRQTGKKLFRQLDTNGFPRVLHIPNIPLYWPQIVRRKTDNILLVEGEKKARRLQREGLLGTTFAGGSNFFHEKRKVLLDGFRGRNVILLPDNDAPGKKWMVGSINLLNGVARKVSVVRPDFLRLRFLHDDVYDWFEGGGTTQILDQLIFVAMIDNKYVENFFEKKCGDK